MSTREALEEKVRPRIATFAESFKATRKDVGRLHLKTKVVYTRYLVVLLSTQFSMSAERC